MAATPHTGRHSVHCVTTGWQWAAVLLTLPLVALPGAFIVHFFQVVEPTDHWSYLLLSGMAVSGCIALSFLAIYVLIWARRACVLVSGERMILRGAFSETVITEDDIEGFRYEDDDGDWLLDDGPDFGDRFRVDLKNQFWPLEFTCFEQPDLLRSWVRSHATDLDAQALAEANEAVRQDSSLGLTEADKESRLSALHALVKLFTWPIYIASAVGLANFLFVERDDVAAVCAIALVLAPFILDLLAICSGGQIKLADSKGSRYPQVVGATVSSGFVLLLLSLFEPGTFLTAPFTAPFTATARFYGLCIVVVMVKGWLWYIIDSEARYSFISSALGLVVLFTIWGVPSLHQLNKHLDHSRIEWHQTTVVTKDSSHTPAFMAYFIDVAPWDANNDETVTIHLGRRQLLALTEGMPVWIGVRSGAFGMPWIAAIEPNDPVAQRM